MEKTLVFDRAARNLKTGLLQDGEGTKLMKKHERSQKGERVQGKTDKRKVDRRGSRWMEQR